jgi:hypothetical protein
MRRMFRADLQVIVFLIAASPCSAQPRVQDHIHIDLPEQAPGEFLSAVGRQSNSPVQQKDLDKFAPDL